MVKEAEKMKEADKLRKETVDLKNEAETTVIQTEKSLNEHRDKIQSSDAEEIEKAIADLR
jgi:molecular chaperone DnaK